MSYDPETSRTEQEYIKNLEAKNKALEQELQQAKAQPGVTKEENASKKTNSQSYFSIGSTEEDVLNVMGEPDSYLITAPEAHKFFYGLSAVYFFQGEVISYDNLDGNLKVKVKK